MDLLVTFPASAKAPWSWGRMHGILSEGRKIESRCQLEKTGHRIKIETIPPSCEAPREPTIYIHEAFQRRRVEASNKNG